MELIIDVPEFLFGVMFTSLVSLATIYGYNYYNSYSRRKSCERVLSVAKNLWDICCSGTTMGAQLAQVSQQDQLIDLLRDILPLLKGTKSNGFEGVVNILNQPEMQELITEFTNRFPPIPAEDVMKKK